MEYVVIFILSGLLTLSVIINVILWKTLSLKETFDTGLTVAKTGFSFIDGMRKK